MARFSGMHIESFVLSKGTTTGPRRAAGTDTLDFTLIMVGILLGRGTNWIRSGRYVSFLPPFYDPAQVCVPMPRFAASVPLLGTILLLLAFSPVLSRFDSCKGSGREVQETDILRERRIFYVLLVRVPIVFVGLDFKCLCHSY